MQAVQRRKTRCFIAALTLLSAAIALPQSAQADDHPLIQAIDRVFQRSQTDELKEYGLDNSTQATTPVGYNHSIKGCWMKKGEAKINTPTLEPGVEYAVIGGGDNTAKKIKISILNPGGQIRMANDTDPVLTESTEDNNMPGVVFKLNKKQGAGIRITLEDVDENAGQTSAYVAFVLLRKDAGWDVPLENMKTAATKLQKRLDKVREANPNGADLSYAWFSIHGGVIPKGSSSQNGHNLNTSTEYLMIASSDDNTDALEMTLNGIVREPKDEEKTNNDPKVTYKRGPKTQFSAQHTVKNNGETALVLVAIVQIIKAN